MYKLFLIALLAVVACSESGNSTDKKSKNNIIQSDLSKAQQGYLLEENHAIYRNDNFSFKANFSSDFVPKDTSVPLNTDGFSFYNDTYDAELSIWGSLGFEADTEKLFENTTNEQLAELDITKSLFRQSSELKKLYFSDIILSSQEEAIIYKRLSDNFYVISGTDNKGNIFYQKTLKIRNIFVNYRLIYPQIYREKFDQYIKQITVEPTY